MVKCVACLRGFCNECGIVSVPCDCTHSGVVDGGVDNEPGLLTYSQSKPEPKRREKHDNALKDPHSTGRKRAARQYPLDPDGDCEWKDASPENPMGGGLFPVTVGCVKQQAARHHGPDKNTLNNDEGNVHRICHWHHNMWHRANDPEYDPSNPIIGD